VFGGWALPGHTGGAYGAPQTPRWISGVGTGKEGEGEEGKGEGRKAREGKRERKEEGLDHRQ